MFRKGISLVLLIIVIFTGCNNSPISNNQISKTITVTSTQNNVDNGKSIPFKYAFTGFVPVKEIYSDLPVGTKVFNTQEEWTEFKNQYLYYEDIPNPGYIASIDFTKDSVVYESDLDAKADVYAQAWQINKITLKDKQINIERKELVGNLRITATNFEGLGGHRYVIVVTVNKNDLQLLK